jgi:hypothetical protein
MQRSQSDDIAWYASHGSGHVIRNLRSNAAVRAYSCTKAVRMHTDRFYPERAACFDRSVATFSSQTVGVTKQGAVQIGVTRDNQPGQYRSAVGTFDGCTDWCLDASGERHHIGTVGIDLQGCPSQDINRAVLDRGHRAVLYRDQRATLCTTLSRMASLDVAREGA